MTTAWPFDGMAFGGDYNPEQWDERTWREDVDLMAVAGVNAVSLGVFAWAKSEPRDGEFDFGWLDRIMDLLHEGRVAVNLATPTAAPPMWLIAAHPEIATVSRTGVRTYRGGRLAWSPSSEVFREYALRHVRALATHVAAHPALRMWHVGNEFGNENADCYSAETERAFQVWLADRHGNVGSLNEAWGTAFWGHQFSSFDEVPVPREARTGHSPSLLLDFKRFTSEALRAHYLAEREVLREITPHVPVGTNFMIQRGGNSLDHRRWAADVDIVANDHYTMGGDPLRREDIWLSADRTRGVAGGRPWLLLEHSTSAVSWQGTNRAKQPGEMTRDSVSHIARGADGAMFFQWRQSTAGAEQFHSAMVPHAGADTDVFREVTELGRIVKALAEVRGSRVERGDVAVLWDMESVWAYESGPVPTTDLRFPGPVRAVHSALTRSHIPVDVVHPHDALDGYRLVIAPLLFLLDDRAARALTAFVEAGGHLLVTPMTGTVDAHNRVIPGGYPGLLRDLLGMHVEQLLPLLGDTVQAGPYTARDLITHVRVAGADIVETFGQGPLAGQPAITTHRVGNGRASYVAMGLDPRDTAAMVNEFARAAGASSVVDAPEDVEAVRRVGTHDTWMFLINHGDIDTPVGIAGHEVVTGGDFGGVLPAGAVAVVRERPAAH